MYKAHQGCLLIALFPTPSTGALSSPPGPTHRVSQIYSALFHLQAFAQACSVCQDYPPWLVLCNFSSFSSQLTGPFSWNSALKLLDWPVASSLSHRSLSLLSSRFHSGWFGLVSLLVFLVTVGRALMDHTFYFRTPATLYVCYLHAVGTSSGLPNRIMSFVNDLNQVMSNFVLR